MSRLQETALRAVTVNDLKRMTRGKNTKIKLWKNFTIGFEIELEADVDFIRSKEIFEPEPDEDEDDYDERINNLFSHTYNGPTDASNAVDVANFIDERFEGAASINYMPFFEALKKECIEFEPAQFSTDCSWGDPCFGLGGAGGAMFALRRILSTPKNKLTVGDFSNFRHARLIQADFQHVFGYDAGDRSAELEKHIKALNKKIENYKASSAKLDSDTGYLNKAPPNVDSWIELAKKIREEVGVVAKNEKILEYIDTPLDTEFDNSKIPVVILNNRFEKFYPLTGLVPFNGASDQRLRYLNHFDVSAATIRDLSDVLFLFLFKTDDEEVEVTELRSISNGRSASYLAGIVLETLTGVEEIGREIQQAMDEAYNSNFDEFVNENPRRVREIVIDDSVMVRHMESCLEDHALGHYIEETKTDDSLQKGVEIITRVFGKGSSPQTAMREALSFIDALNDFLEKHKEFVTSERTGFHVNIGTFKKEIFKQSKHKPPVPRAMDLLKMILFLGERHALEIFNRVGNEYAAQILGEMTRDENFVALMSGAMFNEHFAKAQRKLQVLIYQKHRIKRRTINFEKLQYEYLEFRFAGNQNYHYPGKAREAIRMSILAIAAAIDPQLFRNEYMKKLSRLVTLYGQNNKVDEVMAAVDKSGILNKRVALNVTSYFFRKRLPTISEVAELIYAEILRRIPQAELLALRNPDFTSMHDDEPPVRFVYFSSSDNPEVISACHAAADVVGKYLITLFKRGELIQILRKRHPHPKSDDARFTRNPYAIALIKRALIKEK